jgi:hypothetical protein
MSDVNATPSTNDPVNSYLTAAAAYVAKHGVRLSLLKKGTAVHSVEIVALCDMEYATAKSQGLVLSFDYFFIGNMMQYFTLDKFQFCSKQNSFTTARFVHTFVRAINALLPLIDVPLPDLTPKEIPKAVEEPPKKKKRSRKEPKPKEFYVQYENSEKGVKGLLRDFTSYNVDGITTIYETEAKSGHWGVEFKTGLKLYIYLAGHYLDDESDDRAFVSEVNEVYEYKDGGSTLRNLKKPPKTLSKYAKTVEKTSAR